MHKQHIETTETEFNAPDPTPAAAAANDQDAPPARQRGRSARHHRGEGAKADVEEAQVESQTTDTPRIVIRGESTLSPQESNDAAIVDWLNFTFHYDLSVSRLIDLDKLFRNAFGFSIGAPRKSGFSGYDKSWELGDGLGIFAAGGDAQAGTSLVSLSGRGCSAVKNWLAVYELLVILSARITRVDLAHDDLDGTFNIKSALQFLLDGGFIARGRPPQALYIDDFDSNEGKTLNVGKRKNGKLLRVYEKGKQLGDPNSPWVRWELELHNQDRLIPLDTLLRPGVYLAGSYPCMGWVSETQDRIKTTTKQQEISYAHLLKSCKQSYGKLFWMMNIGLGYDATAIIEELAVKGIPRRLNIPVVGGGDS